MNTSKFIFVISLITFCFTWYSCGETEKKDNGDKSEVSVEKSESSSVSEPTAAMSDQISASFDSTTISADEMSRVLSEIASKMEAEKLAYDRDKQQDSPGIFHKIVDEFKKQLPVLADESKYQYPPSEVNTTRLIADWYYKNDNLKIVQDAMASRNEIKAGSVMFYGKSGKTFKGFDIDQLTNRKNNYTNDGIIQHIAVVTNVKRDADGNVLEYTIMHGRRPGKHAQRSNSKEDQSPNKKGLPPFGNWTQQWVAVADIATPVK